MPPLTPEQIQQKEVEGKRMVIIGIGVTILLSLPFAFLVGGDAHTKEQYRQDDIERRNQISRAQNSLYQYAERNEGLYPESLAELEQADSTLRAFADPITSVPYVYTVGATYTDYRLCTAMQSGEEYCVDGDAPRKRESNTYSGSEIPVTEKMPSYRSSDGTFFNTYHDYSIRFPKSWTKSVDEDSSSLVTFFSPGEDANIQIWATLASEETTMSWFSNLRKTKLASTRGFLVTAEKDTTLNGMSAHIIEYSWEGPNGDPIKTRMTMLIQGSYYYEFSATARGGEFAGTEAVFANILSTFKITKR